MQSTSRVIQTDKHAAQRNRDSIARYWQRCPSIITFAKEIMFYSAFVCLYVSRRTQKVVNKFLRLLEGRGVCDYQVFRVTGFRVTLGLQLPRPRFVQCFLVPFPRASILLGHNVSMFFHTVPSLLGFGMHIHHLCSSSSLELYVMVFRFASFLLFLLQEYLNSV